MTREELEKDFDEKFFVNNWNIPVKEYVEIKNHIFNELIPEVLREIVPINHPIDTDNPMLITNRQWHNDCIFRVKQKAKELWFII